MHVEKKQDSQRKLFSLSIEEIKQQVDGYSVISTFVRFNSKGMSNCPFHNDKTASFIYYPNSGKYHCFGCGVHGDIFDFVERKLDLTAGEALEWVWEYNDFDFSLHDVKPIPFERVSYKGPVHIDVIKGWHKDLKNRSWLYQRRLFDDTIDDNMIGWSTRQQAHVFPYWTGKPGHSEVEIVQYRINRTGIYIGMEGHYRKALLNRHLLDTNSWAIIFVGTMDALLAAQDGLPALGLNGIHMFKPEWVELFKDKDRVVVVPDKDNEQEYNAAVKISKLIGSHAYVKQLPESIEGKDYSDMRMNGWSPLVAQLYFKAEGLF